MNSARTRTRKQVTALVGVFLGLAAIASAVPSAAQDAPALEQLLTKDE
jgi:hypothetical protein